MKIDITFRDLDATQAAAILQMGKANGAELALFLATPGANVVPAAKEAVAAATGGIVATAAHAGLAPAAQAPPAVQTPPAAAAPPASAAREPGSDDGPPSADLEKFSRYPTTRAVVKALFDSGMTGEADILAKCLELREAGVTPLKAVPEDQFAGRISAALVALTG